GIWIDFGENCDGFGDDEIVMEKSLLNMSTVIESGACNCRRALSPMVNLANILRWRVISSDGGDTVYLDREVNHSSAQVIEKEFSAAEFFSGSANKRETVIRHGRVVQRSERAAGNPPATETFSYDAAGRVISHRSLSGGITTYH